MPFLLNAWYVGALGREIPHKPVGRVLLNKRIVFFRDSSGTVAALDDQCPHRFAPLSLGRVRDNALECGYHGLRFGQDGSCTLNPHGSKRIPPSARVRSYPVHERTGFVWFWPGDPELADPRLIPEYSFLGNADQFTAVDGKVYIAGNYQLVSDNLLDLSHVEFLHPLFAQAEGVDVHKTEFLQEGDTVIANRWKPNSLVHGLAKFVWTSASKRGDARSNMRWDPPARLTFDLGVTEVGAPNDEGIHMPNVHLLTPETETTTHYFWALARNRKLNDGTLSETLATTLEKIFVTEDGPMIEAQQRVMGSKELMEMRPVMLESDLPSVRARRVLARLIAEENQREETGAPVLVNTL